jgi:hypothetical membrane protein
VTGVLIGDMRTGRSGRNYQLTWGVIGIIAQIAFMAGWLIAETWQGPGYSPITNTISDLQAATAPHVWFPIACFAVGGLGTFCFAVLGLRPALAKAGRVDAYAVWMLAFSALALGNSFPLIPFRLVDPGATAARQLHSAGGLTDAIVSSIAFLVLVLTPIPLGRRLARVPEWRRLVPVMKAARYLGFAAFIALSLSSMADVAQGLAERVLVTVCMLWIVALAGRLISISRHACRAVA